MEPEIVERPKLLLAGIVNCGKTVGDIDIHSLWEVYMQSEPQIPNRVEGSWYEVHVLSERGNGIYSVIAGAEVTEVGELPIEVSLRVVPAGQYAHFAHCMRDGGYGDAFAKVEAWVRESGTEVEDFGLQHYDRDFDPASEDSVLHIYMPLVRTG